MNRAERMNHPDIPEIEIVVIGGGIVGTCLATFLEGNIFDHSPYSPASRLFWNEFYIGSININRPII